MARKIFIVYLIYVVLVFLLNTYAFKENYDDAVLKAVLSGIIFTAVYAYIVIKNDKKQKEQKLKEETAAKKKKKKR